MKHPIKCVYQGIQLRRFTPEEFKGWTMSIELLIKLDLLAISWRDITNKGINISPVEGAIGRNGIGASQHYWEQFGEVRAIDIFPQGCESLEDAELFLSLANSCGFTGIGIYPEAVPTIMFHVDVRENESPLEPATWGAIRSEDPNKTWDYTSLQYALEILE